jgi:hypothetical protein
MKIMLYKIKTTSWTYTDSARKVHSESEMASIFDSTYMSIQQFHKEVLTKLAEAFEADLKVSAWKRFSNQLRVPCPVNVEDSMTAIEEKIESKIKSKDKSAKVSVKRVGSGESLLIEIDSTVSKDDMVQYLNDNLESFRDIVHIPFSHSTESTLYDLISRYSSKSEGNFSAEDKAIVEQYMAKYNIKEISQIYGKGYFILAPDKFVG